MVNIKTAKDYITLLRPKHWLKNSLVFAPIMYAQNLSNLNLLISVARSFAAFCLISSVVYVINDIVDAEKDRKHPVKRNRPIASGKIKANRAIIFAIVMLATSFPLTVIGFNNYNFALFAALYLALNLVYTFSLKHYAIVDCFCIATGFLIRLFAGGAASATHISEWLFLTVTAAALFMAFGKRRGEMIKVADTANTRKALSNYDLGFLNGMIFVCAGLSIVFYALWSIQSVQAMIYTVPLVLFIVCRYLLIVHSESSHGDPISVILSDKLLILVIGAFGIISVILLYI